MWGGGVIVCVYIVCTRVSVLAGFCISGVKVLRGFKIGWVGGRGNSLCI